MQVVSTKFLACPLYYITEHTLEVGHSPDLYLISFTSTFTQSVPVAETVNPCPNTKFFMSQQEQTQCSIPNKRLY